MGLLKNTQHDGSCLFRTRGFGTQDTEIGLEIIALPSIPMDLNIPIFSTDL